MGSFPRYNPQHHGGVTFVERKPSAKKLTKSGNRLIEQRSRKRPTVETIEEDVANIARELAIERTRAAAHSCPICTWIWANKNVA